MIISHVKIIAFQLSLFCKKLSLFKDCPLCTKQKNIWMLGNTRFISRVEHDISLVRWSHSWDIMFNIRNKSGISAHPCIILYLLDLAATNATIGPCMRFRCSALTNWAVTDASCRALTTSSCIYYIGYYHATSDLLLLLLLLVFIYPQIIFTSWIFKNSV
jgi:hypothetical protein